MRCGRYGEFGDGLVRSGKFWCGKAGSVRWGLVGCDTVWYGVVRYGKAGKVVLGVV